MALRGLVTGSDSCAPGDAGGAGPSNALGGLADAILGKPTKAHGRLQEVCWGRRPALGRHARERGVTAARGRRGRG
jgi:hypothetical protein